MASAVGRLGAGRVLGGGWRGRGLGLGRGLRGGAGPRTGLRPPPPPPSAAAPAAAPRGAQGAGLQGGAGGWGALGWRGFAAGGAGGAGPGAGDALGESLRRAKALWAGVSAAASAPGRAVGAHLIAPARAVGGALAGAGEKARQGLAVHVVAFWHQYRASVFALASALGVYVLWRTMYRTASWWIDLSESMAELGFLALAAACTLAGILWWRQRVALDPESVYRAAMTRLNTDPRALELLGAPIAGSDLRASVKTGGGLKVRLWPRPSLKVRSRRVHMIFPVQAPRLVLRPRAGKGLVSIEAKKRFGRYEFKLLAVDVTSESGEAGETFQLFLHGDEARYRQGKVLDVLRKPFLAAAGEAAERELEREDDVEDAEELEQREERWSERGSVDSGMYFYEHVWEWVAGAGARVRRALQIKERSAI